MCRKALLAAGRHEGLWGVPTWADRHDLDTMRSQAIEKMESIGSSNPSLSADFLHKNSRLSLIF
jgi:hypothetical protein